MVIIELLEALSSALPITPDEAERSPSECHQGFFWIVRCMRTITDEGNSSKIGSPARDYFVTGQSFEVITYSVILQS